MGKLFKGESGKDSGNVFTQDPEALRQMEARQRAANDPRLAQALASYGTQSGGSADDLVRQLQGMGLNEPGQLSQALQVAATDPISGSKFATDQVQNNAILGQLFGKEGTMSRTAKEEQDLASRGFSLKPEDNEAYGQASSNIARQFGRQDASLAQALAARGISGGGAQLTGFASSAGNKMERLAQAQRQIADDRMKMNLDRLGQTRNFLSQLGQQGAGAIQDQFGRNMSGRQQTQSELAQSLQGRQQQQQMLQQQANENLSQQMATKTGGLLGAAQRGLMSGVEGMSGGYGDAVVGGAAGSMMGNPAGGAQGGQASKNAKQAKSGSTNSY